MRTSVQQQEQAIQRRSGIPMAQPEAAERTEAPPPGLTTSSLSATRPRAAAAPEYASGARFPAGGNQLRGRFHDPLPGEATSMTVTFFCPPFVQIDFGDGSPPEQVDGLGGAVEHEYAEPAPGTPHPWVYDVTIVDGLGRLRGEHRFSLPHAADQPIDIAATVASRFPIP